MHSLYCTYYESYECKHYDKTVILQYFHLTAIVDNKNEFNLLYDKNIFLNFNHYCLKYKFICFFYIYLD